MTGENLKNPDEESLIPISGTVVGRFREICKEYPDPRIRHTSFVLGMGYEDIEVRRQLFKRWAIPIESDYAFTEGASVAHKLMDLQAKEVAKIEMPKIDLDIFNQAFNKYLDQYGNDSIPYIDSRLNELDTIDPGFKFALEEYGETYMEGVDRYMLILGGLTLHHLYQFQTSGPRAD